MSNPMYSPSEFVKTFDPDERVNLVAADGMWWTTDKLAKFSKVDKEFVSDWLKKRLQSEKMIRSQNAGVSFRMPKKEIYSWYESSGLPMDSQLIEKLFPPRIWNGISEVEGFESAPLREISIVKFSTENEKLRDAVIEALKGVAVVRKIHQDVYRAFGMNADYIREIIRLEYEKHGESPKSALYRTAFKMRRELVDFDEYFLEGMTNFYKQFAKTLLKNKMDTIKIYIPDEDDQSSQFLYWVLSAIESYDESKAVPFSGYLEASIKWWPYDLPSQYLGNDLSKFQLAKSRAIKEIQKTRMVNPSESISNLDLASQMGIDLERFLELEDENLNWMKYKSATTLSWESGSDEKASSSITNLSDRSSDEHIALCSVLTKSILKATLRSNCFVDGIKATRMIDSGEFSEESFSSLDESFVSELKKAIMETDDGEF